MKIGRGEGRLASKKTRFSSGEDVFASKLFSKGNSILCFPSWYVCAETELLNSIKKIALFFIFIFTPAQSLFAQPDTPQRHYTYIGKDNKLADLFYNNNNYYQCKTDRHCRPKTDKNKSTPNKRMAFFVLDKKSGLVIPTFLQCMDNGTSVISMAEDLIPIVNQRNEADPCEQIQQLPSSLPTRFINDTLQTLESLDNDGCPKEDRSCANQITDMFAKDLNNLLRPFSKMPSPTTEMGCLSTLFTNLWEGLWSTAKLLLWELPKGVANVAKNTWNYFFNKEQETSTAMLYASVMSETMAQALSKGDFAKFYSELRKNFFKFIGAIREFYGELMGCMEWSGTPYDSECLKKTNWSCPTCESTTNFLCGLTGQLGTGMALGAVLGVTKATIAVSKMKRQIANEPARFGFAKEALEQIEANKTIRSLKNQTQEAKYRIGTRTRPIASYTNAALGEMKTLFALGENFRKLIAVNPVTAPFHMSFQAGQKMGHKRLNRLTQEHNIPGLTLGPTAALGRAYGRALANVQKKFDESITELHKLTKGNYHPRVYNDISRNYITVVKKELERVNIKATPIQGGRGLRLEKGGEVFEYRPNWRDKIEKARSDMSLEDFKHFVANGDQLLDVVTPVGQLTSASPGFLKELRHKAHSAKNTFIVQSGPTDGMIYLGYFTAQSRNAPQEAKCEDLLYDMELIGSQDVTQKFPVESNEN